MEPFELRTVVHLTRPWGEPARNLEQLRAGIARAPDGVLFRHAVQGPLRHPSAEEPAPDDWSAWVAGAVLDEETAERLSFAVQARHDSPASTREAALGVLESVPALRRRRRRVPEGTEFVFLECVSLDVASGCVVNDAREALEALVDEEAGTWFFHLVEEPWRTGASSLGAWLEAGGERRAADWLREAADSGLPIDRARAKLSRRARRAGLAQRLAAAIEEPEIARREAARRAVARLVRGTRTGDAR